MFKLVIQDDEGKTTVVPLIRDEITIGRKEGNTIRLTERNVSRRHARILRNNGEVQIEDLGSYNGIRVNNARIAERVSLRVSDQVQIGDYKLYLKAEGVEQVDDARTMPIERIDAPATDVMQAVAPSSPTVPIPAQAAAAAAAGGPSRAMGTADTDPGGRPVATAAQVAALTQPVTYGKLVVTSSNYAGKEFDLTRPQMIVGRTDENDLVINHRSISRNHAKITRDTETGRYTISDLQSSNGVRVNGQDYGKVELRRGDVVDLGHVRLRFVEPGEDFVFARDAVISDVPEAGGKRGVFVAVALAVLLLAGAGVFFVLNHGKEPGTKKTDNNGTNLASGGSSVASGSDQGGSNVASGVAIETPDAAVAAVQQPAGSNDEAGQIRIECLDDQAQKKWQDLDNCANKLASLDAGMAKQLKDKAKAEMANELAVGKLDDAIRDGDVTKARKILDTIDDDSVYRKPAQDKFTTLETKNADDWRARANAVRHRGKCSELLDTLAQQAQSSAGSRAAEAVRSVHCDVASSGGDHGGSHPAGNGSGTPPPSCDADEDQATGMSAETAGHHAEALKSFSEAYRCKPSPRLVQLAFMAACNAGDKVDAKVWYHRLTPDGQNRYVSMCIRRGIQVPDLQ